MSCSHQATKKKRSFASASKCVLEKHQTKPHFRLRIGDKLYNNFWYDEAYANQILANLKKRDKC